MTYVWRIEFDDGESVYRCDEDRYHVHEYLPFNGCNGPRQLSACEDPGIRRFVRRMPWDARPHDYIFGFSNRAQYVRWFNAADQKRLEKYPGPNRIILAKYEVNEDLVGCGEAQCMWPKVAGHRVATYAPTDACAFVTDPKKAAA